MRAVAVVLVLLAIVMGVAISEAKRIHKLRAVLRAEESEAVEAEVVADADAEASLPFDGDYWTEAGRPDVSKLIATAAKGKPLSTAEILKKFFTAENIELAQQQGASVVTALGTYKAFAASKSCNNGVCDDKWADINLVSATGTRTQGGEGTVRLICSVPKDLATAKCTVEAYMPGGSTMAFSCTDVGGAGRSCGTPFYQYFSSSGSWYSQRFTTDSLDALEFYFTKDQLVANWKWHGNASNKLVFTSYALYVTPFAGYKPIVAPAMPAALSQLTTASKKAKLNTAAILKKFFTSENIELAQQQGVSVVTSLGPYDSAAITRSCNNGACTVWKPIDLVSQTGTRTQGGQGTVRLVCSVPKDLATAKCTVEAYFPGGSTQQMSCSDVGGAAPSCGTPFYQYFSSSGSWYSQRFTTDVNEAFDFYFTADALVIHWKWRGVASNVLVGTDYTWYTATPFSQYQPNVAPAAPAPLPALVTASKAKQLTTADLLAKFFTKDNIALAQMQGSSIPVKATIGAYKAIANTRSCNNGICRAWTEISLLTPAGASGTQVRGGEGSVVLTCSVPKDLAAAKCTVEAFYGGGSTLLFSCSDIGGAGRSCTTPSYQYFSSSGSWYSQRFTTDVTEVFAAYFTADALVVNWRWRGVASNSLVGTDMTFATTTPFADFSTPVKTNCLSKTTTSAIFSAAEEKKNLKNKITLSREAVDALIKNAPYPNVQTAIDKIKGIGPVNVVYVSFMWNFEC